MEDNNKAPVKQESNRDEQGKFIPGMSGNPNGRPRKEHSITDTIKAMMDEKPEIKRALGEKILDMAMKGDVTAIKTLWQYMDGMPLQKSEISGKDGMPVIFPVPSESMVSYGISSDTKDSSE